ncbi:hypothetical protein YC2023_053891 [Brassica napus]
MNSIESTKSRRTVSANYHDLSPIGHKDAYKILSAQGKQNRLKPHHSTYKILVGNLKTIC